jgi:integrase/recombinase XerD
LKDVHEVEEPNAVKTGHIRKYIRFLQERGKYTVVRSRSSLDSNTPQNRNDFRIFCKREMSNNKKII